MPKLTIDPARCIGCGRCVGACPSGALRVLTPPIVEKRLAIVNEAACTLCGLCASSCAPRAITISRDEKTTDTVPAADIWVFAQQDNGIVLPVAFELLGKGRELADARSCRLVALLLGRDVKSGTQELIAAGADEVLLCEGSTLEHPLDAPYADVICRMAAARHPEILLFGATAFGRSLAPRVAARLGAGLTADCTGLAIDPSTGLLRQTRPAFGGNLMATIITERHRPQMATVRPGVMPPREPDRNRTGVMSPQPPPAADDRVRLIRTERLAARESIADAEIIISAGRGIGSAKNLALVERLAGLLGGQMGVSRPLVDMGWAEYPHQVGQTGLSVAPRLLIAFGVSGAVQHLAGIGGASTVVAVNTDPDAPIFSVADYRVIGDCIAVLKELITHFS